MPRAVLKASGERQRGLALPWSRPPEPPDPAGLSLRGLLLASEGRRIPEEAVRFAAKLAKRHGAKVRVMSIARIWGTSFGLPAPGLLPTRKEWDEQHGLVAAAVAALERRKVAADGQVVGTRNPTQRILAEAKRFECDAIVMAADPPRHWLVAGLLWSQEPYRVRQRARIPVYLVPPSG